MSKHELNPDLIMQAHDARLDLINKLEAKKATATGQDLLDIEKQLRGLIARSPDQDVATAALIDKELNNAVARSAEGITQARTEQQKLSQIKTAWSPMDNINEMMDHLRDYNDNKDAEVSRMLEDMRSIFEQINSERRYILQEFLPNCANEKKALIEGNLEDLEPKVIAEYQNYLLDVAKQNITADQLREYKQKFESFRDQMIGIYKNNDN